ncbi:hypothetical protein HID58_052180, partial [Brassica napus]
MAIKDRSLEETPTWALAAVCFVILFISIMIEYFLHFIGHWFKRKNKKALYEALEKSPKFAFQKELLRLGILVVANKSSLNIGKVALVSAYGIHQLHIFIFVLAVFHILYCIITYALGKTKMKKWKSWEKETKTLEYQYANDPERFRFARDTSFGRRHLNIWSKSSFTLWITVLWISDKSGLSYIKTWLYNGWDSYFWLPFLPLLVILIVGAKLQVIISKLGLRIQDKGDVVKGAPVVEPGDDLFWFGRPRFILFLIHLVLFTNAFQLAFFVWSTYEFTLKNCFHHKTEDIAIRITMGVLIQVVCSYITLPLYALVTQMGSSMRPTIFNDRVANALKKWHNTAKKQAKHGNSGSNTPRSSRPTTPKHNRSLDHLLHNRNRSLDHQTSFTASPSPPRLSDSGRHGHGPQHFFDPESQNVSPYSDITDFDNGNIQQPHADVASPVTEEKEITEHVKIDLPEFTFKKRPAESEALSVNTRSLFADSSNFLNITLTRLSHIKLLKSFTVMLVPEDGGGDEFSAP